MARFRCRVSDITYESATFNCSFSGGDSSFSGYRYVRIEVDGDEVQLSSGHEENSGSSTFPSYTFYGLAPETRYDYQAVLGYQADGMSSIEWLYWEYNEIGSFTTDSEPIQKPDKWSWYASNGSATRDQTSKAYDAIGEQGPLTDFSYLVWNDLVDKVDDILWAIGHNWDNTYLTLANTKMTASNRWMTADRFNSLRNNIRLHYYIPESSFPIAVKGAIIKGEYFNNIADYINDWIDSL